MKPVTLFHALILLCLMSCGPQTGEDGSSLAQMVSNQTNTAFKDYWYQGKAEINIYQLEQNRYQNIHPGQTTLIFVTEDFLTDEQVKNDTYTNPNSTPILKTNLINRFTTGLYDYSIMTSVFTPVDTKKFSHTLKTTTSSQDWCGQSWMQINKQGTNYALQQRSYFEKEGDINEKVPVQLLEDEILNRIRLNPDKLPEGTIQLIPSNQYLRLAHQPFKAVTAQASKQPYTGEDFEGSQLQQYRLKIPALQRELIYIFQNEMPFLIEGWTDQYPSAFDQQQRKTTARRQKTIMEPYWKQNNRSDQEKRANLGLSEW